MRRVTLVALAFLVVVASAVLAPEPAAADGRHRFRGHSHGPRLHSAPPKHVPFAHGRHRFHGHSHRPRLHSAPPKHFRRPHGFVPRRHFHGHFGRHKAPFVVGATPVIVSPPPVYTPPPVYVPVPTYAPSPVYVPAPAQRVVEFATGRYELHGDGITVPYRWVWIPNPPVAPPPEAEPATPEPPPVDPSSAAPPAPRRTRPIEVYRWTDDAGVVHLTDRLDNVPEEYRARVTKSQSASAKKGQQ